MSRVMVVDDEDVLAEMLASLIEEMGLKSLVATNGEAALEILATGREPPALIISDVMMPRMNGLELARTLKCDPRLKDVPIILMSAAGRPIDNQWADGFIHKPFDLNVLASTIERHLNQRRRSAA